jgi:hypothetical protein
MAMRTHIGRSLRSTATAGNAPIAAVARPAPEGLGWVDFCRSLGAQHRKPLSHSWRGENRLGIVNPMAWAVRTVDNQLEFGRLFDQQICHCGTL